MYSWLFQVINIEAWCFGFRGERSAEQGVLFVVIGVDIMAFVI